MATIELTDNAAVPPGAALSGTEELFGFIGTDPKTWTPAQVLTYIVENIGTEAFRALINDADNTTLRATLGLAIGTNVQAYDAGLQAIAGATPIADGPHTVGANTITTVGGIITAIA